MLHVERNRREKNEEGTRWLDYKQSAESGRFRGDRFPRQELRALVSVVRRRRRGSGSDRQ